MRDRYSARAARGFDRAPSVARDLAAAAGSDPTPVCRVVFVKLLLLLCLDFVWCFARGVRFCFVLFSPLRPLVFVFSTRV